MPSVIHIKVRGYHLDGFGHVNHGRFVELMEEARWDYFDRHPELKDTLHERGIVHSTVNINVNYRRPASVGDVLRIETGLKSAGQRSITFEQKIILDRSGDISVEAEVVNVFFKREGGRIVTVDDEAFVDWADLNQVR